MQESSCQTSQVCGLFTAAGCATGLPCLAVTLGLAVRLGLVCLVLLQIPAVL
jgi:hypothetical protein